MTVYFDNAATSFPKPEEVYTAVNYVMRNIGANPGRSGHRMAIEASRYIYETRVEAAGLFNAPDEKNIIFTSNVTDALNIALKGFLKNGDHVITSSMEHNSVIRPLHKLSGSGVTFTQAQCSKKGELDPQDIKRAIKKNTKLIVLTHASNICGTIFDIQTVGSIAKESGIAFMVDAAQTAGVMDIDIQRMNIDMLACTGHKSLFGLQGTGILFVRDGINLETVKEGGTGSLSDSPKQPDELPDRHESGTLNTPGIAGLGAGIKFIRAQTTKKIKAKEDELLTRLIDGLKKIDGIILYGTLDPAKQTAVLSFNVQGVECSQIGYILDSEYDIMARVGIHCSPSGHRTLGTYPQGTVRVSLGYFNTREEIDYFLKAMVEIVKKKR